MKLTHAGLGASFVLLSPSFIALPSHAVGSCASSYTYSQISASGFTCQKNDRIFSDFFFTGSTAGFSTGTYAFTANTLAASALDFNTGSSAGYGYKVTIDSALFPNRKFASFATSSTTFGSGPQFKTLSDGSNTVTSNNGSTSPVYSFSPLSSGPISFSGNITVGSAADDSLDSFTDRITLVDYVAPVPGPLPLLGLGAAFKLSRQLRKRSKLAG